jgi:hypothetical protein
VIVQPPKLFHRSTGSLVVLGEHPQFPTTFRFKAFQFFIELGFLDTAEGLGQVNDHSGLIGEQLRVIEGNRGFCHPGPTPEAHQPYQHPAQHWLFNPRSH